jgi:hypothetical protein
LKPSLSFVLCLEFGFAVWLASTTCALRPDFLHATDAVREHPSSEVAVAEFRHQQFLSRVTPFVLGACVFGVLALPTIGLVVLRRPESARPFSLRR